MSRADDYHGATVSPESEPSSAPSLLERYFRPKAAEFDGRLYEWLGVVRFKRVLKSAVRVDPEKRTTNGYVLGGRSLEDVRAFEKYSRRSEVIHLLGLAMAVVFLLLAVWWRALLVPCLIVFIANFHCFLLQRYNRIRVYRVLGRARNRGDLNRSSSGVSVERDQGGSSPV